MIKNNKELLEKIDNDNSLEFLFFWSHKKTKQVTKTCFSQWYESPFMDNQENTYLTAEHYMMAEKALLFDDQFMYEQILLSDNPKDAQKLGRKVNGFKNDVWIKHRFDIVVEANYLKFSQNEELKSFLLNTEDQILVEASPNDKIWGIGLSETNIDAMNIKKWQGLNLLGFSLMEVRKRLQHI